MKDIKKGVNKTLKPNPRSQSNVEVEKGEIVFTKMDPKSNIFELYTSAGKKHGQGGTPLDLPVGDENGKGSSFIFSDRLKVKDKEVLDFFGFDAKAKITVADLMRPLVQSVNKSKEILLDTGADDMSKRTAELNLKNAKFKIDAAKLYQESLKGMKDTPDAESFFTRTGMDPEKVFSINPQEQEQAHQAIQMAVGGLLRKDFGGDPELHYYEDSDPAYATAPTFMANGGTLPKANGGKQLKYTSRSGPGTISAWMAQSADNVTLTNEANSIIEKGIKDGKIINKNGKITILGNFSPSFKERTILAKVFSEAGPGLLATDKYSVESQKAGAYSKANAKKTLTGTGSFVGGFTPEVYEQRYIFSKAIADGKTEDEALELADKHKSTPETRKEFMGFLGVTANDADLKSDDFYKKNFDKVTLGIEKKFPANQFRKYQGNDQIAGFDHFDAIAVEPKAKPAVVNEKPGEYTDGVIEKFKPTPAMNPFGYRQEDINTLNRANEAKSEIRMFMPYQAPIALSTPDTAYYSPERNIAAVMEGVGKATDAIKSFSGPQAAAANAMAIQGNAYEQVANVIGNVADKNVGLFNTYEQSKTQIQNQANLAKAQSDETFVDKVNNVKQNFADSIAKAKDTIVAMKNNALTNAASIFNVNQMQEHFKKDPNTGLIYKTDMYDPFKAESASKTSAVDMYKKYRDQLGSNVDDKTIIKLVAIQLGKNSNLSVDDSDKNDEKTDKV